MRTGVLAVTVKPKRFKKLPSARRQEVETSVSLIVEPTVTVRFTPHGSSLDVVVSVYAPTSLALALLA